MGIEPGYGEPRLWNAEPAGKIARYDAGDLMPSDMGKAYWGAVLKFVQNQGQLDAILADLDKTQATAYASP